MFGSEGLPASATPFITFLVKALCVNDDVT